jgi:Fe-S-cluster containining protein
VWCDKLWEAYILCEPEVVKEEITSFADLLTPSHNEYNICPFRRKMKDGKYKCSIHDTKPTVCKNFTPWKPGWATDENGNSHDVSPTSYTWCEAMIQKRNGK